MRSKKKFATLSAAAAMGVAALATPTANADAAQLLAGADIEEEGFALLRLVGLLYGSNCSKRET